MNIFLNMCLWTFWPPSHGCVTFNDSSKSRVLVCVCVLYWSWPDEAALSWPRPLSPNSLFWSYSGAGLEPVAVVFLCLGAIMWDVWVSISRPLSCPRQAPVDDLFWKPEAQASQHSGQDGEWSVLAGWGWSVWNPEANGWCWDHVQKITSFSYSFCTCALGFFFFFL